MLFFSRNNSNKMLSTKNPLRMKMIQKQLNPSRRVKDYWNDYKLFFREIKAVFLNIKIQEIEILTQKINLKIYKNSGYDMYFIIKDFFKFITSVAFVFHNKHVLDNYINIWFVFLKNDWGSRKIEEVGIFIQKQNKSSFFSR